MPTPTRRGPGRPRVARPRYPTPLRVYATAAEREAISAAAKARGLAVSAYLLAREREVAPGVTLDVAAGDGERKALSAYPSDAEATRIARAARARGLSASAYVLACAMRGET